MKKFVAVVALLMIAAMPAAYAYAEGFGDYSVKETFCEEDFTYAQYEKVSGAVQQLFYAEFKPSEESAYEMVVHHVKSGSGIALTTVLDIAKDYESQTGRKVMAAVNGDFFYNTGSNVDSLVMNGEVVNKGNLTTKHCMGFDNLGGYALGRMTQTQVQLRVTLGDGSSRLFNVDARNAEPSEGEVALYTRGTNVTIPGAGKYRISTEAADLTQYPVEGFSRRTVTGEVVDDKPFTVGSGEFVVVVKGDNEISRFFYENLVYGVACDLIEVPWGDFRGVQYVVGGYDMLVDRGTVLESAHVDDVDDRNGGRIPRPRTTLGVKSDGTFYLCVADGNRTGYAVGMTVVEQAQLAKSMGAYCALELDGGGSSTFVLRQSDGTLKTVNRPTDAGGDRSVSNAVLIVRKEQASQPEPGPDEPEPDNPEKPDPVVPPVKSCLNLDFGSGITLLLGAAAVALVSKKYAEERA